jgi:hypothetical protein
MLHCSKTEGIMPRYEDSSFVSLLSGWVQQGIENFFATQRILVDLAMSQNANAMNLVRNRFADPDFAPATIVTELASEGMTNFIEGQKLLLNLAQKEYDIVATGVKERVAGYPAAVAMTDAAQRGFETFVDMQQEFLKLADKQTHTWLNSIKAGKGLNADGLVDLAREAMETFVRTQRRFLDVIAEETANATTERDPTRKTKKTELSELANEATEAFIDAQKKLIEVAGKQVHAGIKAADRSIKMVPPFTFNPIPDLTRQGVKNFVNAEKALIDNVIYHPDRKVKVTAAGSPKRSPHKTTAKRKRARTATKVVAATA